MYWNYVFNSFLLFTLRHKQKRKKEIEKKNRKSSCYGIQISFAKPTRISFWSHDPHNNTHSVCLSGKIVIVIICTCKWPCIVWQNWNTYSCMFLWSIKHHWHYVLHHSGTMPQHHHQHRASVVGLLNQDLGGVFLSYYDCLPCRLFWVCVCLRLFFMSQSRWGSGEPCRSVV